MNRIAAFKRLSLAVRREWSRVYKLLVSCGDWGKDFIVSPVLDEPRWTHVADMACAFSGWPESGFPCQRTPCQDFHSWRTPYPWTMEWMSGSQVVSHKVSSLIKCFWSWYYNILRVSDYTVSSPTYLLWLEGLHLKANVPLISRITKMLGKRIKANDFEAFGILWEKILRNTMFWLWIKPPLKIPVWNLIKKTEIGNLRFAKNKTLRDAKRGENVWVFWAKVGISGYNW